MKFSKYYRVADGAGRVRFESVFLIDAQFFFKRLLQQTRPGAPRPTLVEVPR